MLLHWVFFFCYLWKSHFQQIR